jgi:hypothetical protein
MTAMDDEENEITVSGHPPDEDAVFQIDDAFEYLKYYGGAEVRFESRHESGAELLIRIRLRGHAEQTIKVPAAALNQDKGICKAVIEQLAF